MIGSRTCSRASASASSPSTSVRASRTSAARSSLLSGVPMNWMTRWPGDFPVFMDSRRGRRAARRRRQRLRRPLPRRHRGDDRPRARRRRSPRSTSDLTGGSPRCCRPRTRPRSARRCSGASACATGSSRLSATDANRFVIRIARQITGRSKILVHNHCYHGSVDETVADARRRPGTRRARAASAAGVDVAETTRVVEINDLEGLERELAEGDVACVLIEPALTNIGIVLADDGYHEARARAHPRGRDAAGHRRDPHALLRPWRLHGRSRPRARLPHDRQADRRRDPDRRLRHERRGRRADPRPHLLARGRRRRSRRHPGRQRALARRRARDARRGPHRGRVRAHDRARASASRTAVADDDRRARPALVDHPARLPRRVHVLGRASANRRRGGRGDGRGPRRAPAPLHAQPRDPADPVPHDGPDVAGDHRRAGRPPHRGLSTRRPPSSPVAEPPVAGSRPRAPSSTDEPLDPEQVLEGDPRTSAYVLAESAERNRDRDLALHARQLQRRRGR